MQKFGRKLFFFATGMFSVQTLIFLIYLGNKEVYFTISIGMMIFGLGLSFYGNKQYSSPYSDGYNPNKIP